MPAQGRVTHRRRIDKVASGKGQPDVNGVARLTIHDSRGDSVQAVWQGRRAQNEGRNGMGWDGCYKDGVEQQPVFR